MWSTLDATTHTEDNVQDHHDEHHRGLAYDMSTLVGRRSMLGLLGGAVLLGAVGCGKEDTPATASSATTSASSAATTTATASGAEIPDETAGPYPGDGSNGPNVLTESGVVRSDITKSFGSASGVAEGIPVTIELTVTDGGSALKGAAVYIWHCDREGRYSLYSEGATEENYLRGVQEADSNGTVKFTSIFPAAYTGRWPHIHFEIYSSLKDATAAGTPVKTTQLAFPEEVCKAVYATTGYEKSVSNLERTPLSDDMVFSDGYDTQMATVTGSTSAGYAAKLPVPV
jgi:protocatechuate 3,4-dioxygenase beta subunit